MTGLTMGLARVMFRRLALCGVVVLGLCACGSSEDGKGGSDVAANDVEFVDFETLAPPDSPNNWLVAPADAGLAKVDETAPVFDVSAERLAAAWKRVVERKARAEVLAVAADGLQVEARQRSSVFGFVDRISARFVPLAEERSTLFAYSRSEVGYWDLGVNRKRLREWLAAVQTEVGTPG